jgi:hypothetical protein
MRGTPWVAGGWGLWAALVETPLWVVAGATVTIQSGGGEGRADAVAGGALLCRAGSGAGSGRLEPARARAARGGRGAG